MISRKFPLAALLAAALLVFVTLAALPASAAEDNPARRTAVETGKAEAATLLEQGKAAEAYELYMRLVREAPDDDAINLGLARAATKARRWNQAVMAYEILLEKYPREAGLYGELANVYMLLGDRESAERSLAMMRSLDGTTSKTQTDAALDLLESRYSRFQAHGKIRAGALYDSNANMGPRSNDLMLGLWPVHFEDAKKKETFGAYVGADVDLGWRLEQDSAWWLVGDAQGFWRGNTNSDLHDSHSQESQWGRIAGGVRRLTASTLFDARLKAEIFDYEFYQNVLAVGPEATFLWAATPSVQLITRGGLDQRVYSLDSDRNGIYGWLGEYLRLFFGAGNHEFMFGARYLGASPDRSRYGYNGWEASARVLFKLPYGFEFGPHVSFTQEYYNGPATALETNDRRDDRWRLGATLTYRIDEAWSAEASYQYTDNNSKCKLYEYQQHFVSMGLAWSF